ncbi:MAG: hypothetical protein M3345_06345 [Actinomycetota bacterium]|nr:hypothetical protein [Actinomycetota bacterium]
MAEAQIAASGSVQGAKGGAAATAEMTPERKLWRRVLKIGLISGVVAVYLAAVGLVSRFDEREVITELINLGPALLFLMYLVSGYVASRPVKIRLGEPEPLRVSSTLSLAAGAAAGAITGAVVGLLLIVGTIWDPTAMFVEIKQGLMDILSFNQSAGVGVLLQIVVGAVLGVLAAGVHLLSPANRKPFFAGLAAVLLMSLGEPLLRGVLEGLGERIRLVFLDDTSWLYESGGLTRLGAALVLVLTIGGSLLWTKRGPQVKERVAALPENQRKVGRIAAILLLIAAVLLLPQILTSFLSEVIGIVGMYVLLGLGLNIVVGYAGLLDLGYVAFFAIGAYATAILTSPVAFTDGPVGFWIAVPIVVVIAVVCGIIIGAPVLRLRGDYLAIVTLGFGEIVRVVIQSNALKSWTGGPQGILQIPSPSIGGFDFNDPKSLYYLILVCVIAAVFISYRLQESRIGRAWVAMREDEQVAEAMGISIIKTKLLAFAMGAGVGSFAGMFFAVKIGSVFPASMNLLVSIQVLAVIVLGGMGSIPGVIVGAFVLVGLPELLREFVEYRLHIYGAILVAIMLLRPEGLIPSARRRFELHEEEIEEAQFERRHGEDAESGAPVITGAAKTDLT